MMRALATVRLVRPDGPDSDGRCVGHAGDFVLDAHALPLVRPGIFFRLYSLELKAGLLVWRCH